MAELAKRQELTESAQPAVDESALQAYLGKKKYGTQGMIALQKAGREGASKEKMASIRARHDKMDEADEAHKETKLIKDLRAQGLSDKEIVRKMEQIKRGTTKTVAKEADLDEISRGEYIKQQDMQAEKSGKDKFKAFGQTFDTDEVKEADYVGLEEKKAKPDYIDLDKDGDRKETMKKAAADKKKSKSAGTAFDPEVAKSMISKDPHPRYDVKDTGYSKRYTRKTEEPQDDDDSKDSQADRYASPKKKGRPKGPEKGPERVTKGSYKYKSGRPTKTEENLDTDGVMMTRPSNMSSEGMDSIALVDKGEYDREGDMAKEQLYTMKMAAQELSSILGDDENLPEWVQSKITKALDYIDTARDYMKSTKADRNMEPVAEKAVSKNQAVAARIARGVQKGDIEAEPGTASAEMARMRPKELRKFAKTDTKGLPKKVKEQTAEEPKKAKGGFEFGKGVYESMDHKFRQALTEGMNISVNMNTGPDGQPTKNITVSADGDDAEALAMLLKMAGMGTSHDSHQAVDENSPDYPTNTETSDDAFQYSGGLNGPKSTGQTTVPVIASQLRRQVSMEESVELERDLFRLYQNYKAQ